MTEQSSDWVFYENSRYQLLHGANYTSPIIYGIGVPVNCSSTATYRGYEAEYDVIGGQFYLTKLHAGTGKPGDTFLPIGDVYPQLESLGFDSDGQALTYYNVFYYLQYSMNITGTITISYYGNDDRDKKRYEYLGASYFEVLKVKLENDFVQIIKDVTDQYLSLSSEINAIYTARSSLFKTYNPSYRSDELIALQKEFQAFLEEELPD
jgi:hypothetical protein